MADVLRIGLRPFRGPFQRCQWRSIVQLASDRNAHPRAGTFHCEIRRGRLPSASLGRSGCTGSPWWLDGAIQSKRLSSQPTKHEDEQNNSTPAGSKTPLTKRLRTAFTPHENIYTLPNLLTFSRLLAAPAIGYLVLHDAPAWALGLFVYAGATDLVDGWMARRWGLQTVVGTVIDPMADKALMTVLTVCLAVKATLPLYLAVLILGRDGLLGLAAIYYRYISLPPPKTMARFWDFSLPSAEVHPTTISKVNTALQLALIGSTLGLPLVDATQITWAPEALKWLQYTVATTTIWSGASYVYSKDAVRILGQEKK